MNNPYIVCAPINASRKRQRKNEQYLWIENRFLVAFWCNVLEQNVNDYIEKTNRNMVNANNKHEIEQAEV